MGTDIDNVLEDLLALEEHIEYFAVCQNVKLDRSELEAVIKNVKQLIESIGRRN